MNSTSPRPLNSLSALAGEFSIPRGLFWTISAFLFLSPLTWKAVSGKTRYSYIRHLPHIILLSHVVSGFVEILAYYGPFYRYGTAPSPDRLFLATCVCHSLSSIILNASTWRVKAGQHDLVRATFNVMILQRLLAGGIAYYTGSLVWHNASVKLLNSYIWARLIVVYLANYITGFPTYGSRYTAGIVGAEIMGLWEGDYPHGMIMYFVLGSAFLWLDKWSSGKDQ